MANERLISADGFIEDIKTEIMNLYMDGKKGTPRPREELYAIIDRINEQPTVDVVPLPCNIGDTAWIIRASNSRLIVKQGVVTEIHIRFGHNPFIVMANVGRGEWGAKVFATEKEAYAAIGERKDNAKECNDLARSN